MEWLCIPGRSTLHAFEFAIDADVDREHSRPNSRDNQQLAVCRQTSWYTYNQLFVAEHKQCSLCLRELNRRKQIQQLSEYFRLPRK